MSIGDLGFKIPRWVIPIGIPADDLRQPVPAEFSLGAGIGIGTQVITFLGRISAKKGVPLLIEAFRRIAPAFPQAQLVIAGPDDEDLGRDLRSSIATAGLVDRVTFLGVVTGIEKRALLQRSDVFVLASAAESFGIAVVEAMAVGCPVVVSPEVAIEDVVRRTGAGLVVDRDPSAIANAIAAILSDSGRAEAMGRAGRRTVDQQFSWPVVATQMEAMYDAVVSAQANNPLR
jgi:glycosyltransferase involved in cell wall biosynthesis